MLSRCNTQGHAHLSSTSQPATLHTAGMQLQPSDMQQTPWHTCPLLGYTCILPQAMPQIFLTSEVISGMSSLLETGQSSGITGWKHKPHSLQLRHLSRPHCPPPNSQMVIPLHSCSKINCVQHSCNPHLLKITNTLVYVHIVIVCITPECPLYVIL